MSCRLDIMLLNLDLVSSRSKAQNYIKSGAVKVNGLIANKPNKLVSELDKIEILFNPCIWVSRAGLKLYDGLDYFKPDILLNSVCLDIGSSTGGFTEVLLSKGVEKVYAVDVGIGQLDNKLRNDSRVILMESTDARDVGSLDLPLIDILVSDLSFISLKKALIEPMKLVKSGGFGMILIKPQYEVGRENIGKNGIVKKNGSTEKTIEGIKEFFIDNGWCVKGCIACSTVGFTGNQEYILHIYKDRQ